MRLEPLGRFGLTYLRLDEVDYEAGGQLYGELEGYVEGSELEGVLKMVNLGVHRTDGEYSPSLRGILTLKDHRKLFVTMEGLSLRDPQSALPERVALVAVRFRSGDPSLADWNRVLAVAECRGGLTLDGVSLTGSLYRCVPEV